MSSFKLTDYDRLVYENELKSFLPDKIIDAHTHIWDKTCRGQVDHNGGSSWTGLIAYEMTGQQLRDCLDSLLPGKETNALVFGSCTGGGEIENNYVSSQREKFGYPMLYRTSYEMSGEELEREVINRGCLGIKPYLTFCPPYIPSSEIRIFDFLPHEHLEVANRHGWIVMLHIAREKRLRDKVNIAQLMEIEEKYPNLKLIVAHIGRAYAKEDIGDAFDVLGKTKNMMFDFTANVCDDAIEACIKAVGPKRLIFGSDLPIALMRMYRITENGVYYNVVPRGLYGDVSNEPHMRETDEKDVTIMYYEQIRAMKRVAEKLNLSKEDIEDIFYNNAKRLIG